MIRHIHLTAVFILVIESTFGLDPPQDVKIVGSDLQWRPPNDDNVLYSLQYKPNSKSEDEWLNVSSHIGTKLKSFRITPEFYGAVFRVRSEKENHISEWQYSNPVQCLNVDSCVPVMNLNVKPEMVQLTLTHMDRSLEKEYGEHVEFNVSYWRKDNRGYPEVQSVIISRNKDIDDLEPWQNYCFQAEYLLFEKPYGNPSEEKCEIIPESPEAVRRRAFICSISATLFVLFLCGACIFLLFKHHKKVKQCLQPLHLEIPDHYIEVLQNGFPLEACPSRSCQSLRSYDIITVMEYSNVEENCQKEEQEKRSPA